MGAQERRGGERKFALFARCSLIAEASKAARLKEANSE